MQQLGLVDGRDGMNAVARRLRVRFVQWMFVSAVGLSVAAPRIALADSAGASAADRATARQLAAEGQAAFEKGDFETAADRFARADALVLDASQSPEDLVRAIRTAWNL